VPRGWRPRDLKPLEKRWQPKTCRDFFNLTGISTTAVLKIGRAPRAGGFLGGVVRPRASGLGPDR